MSDPVPKSGTPPPGATSRHPLRERLSSLEKTIRYWQEELIRLRRSGVFEIGADRRGENERRVRALLEDLERYREGLLREISREREAT